MFVHHYPRGVKAFYMQPDPERPDTVLACDLIAPEGYGEIVGGSQRMHDYQMILDAIDAQNCRAKPTSGTSTCANTAPSRTAASAWAWSGC